MHLAGVGTVSAAAPTTTALVSTGPATIGTAFGFGVALFSVERLIVGAKEE
jgi:hypothetical protein